MHAHPLFHYLKAHPEGHHQKTTDQYVLLPLRMPLEAVEVPYQGVTLRLQEHHVKCHDTYSEDKRGGLSYYHHTAIFDAQGDCYQWHGYFNRLHQLVRADLNYYGRGVDRQPVPLGQADQHGLMELAMAYGVPVMQDIARRHQSCVQTDMASYQADLRALHALSADMMVNRSEWLAKVKAVVEFFDGRLAYHDPQMQSIINLLRRIAKADHRPSEVLEERMTTSDASSSATQIVEALEIEAVEVGAGAAKVADAPVCEDVSEAIEQCKKAWARWLVQDKKASDACHHIRSEVKDLVLRLSLRDAVSDSEHMAELFQLNQSTFQEIARWVNQWVLDGKFADASRLIESGMLESPVLLLERALSKPDGDLLRLVLAHGDIDLHGCRFKDQRSVVDVMVHVADTIDASQPDAWTPFISSLQQLANAGLNLLAPCRTQMGDRPLLHRVFLKAPPKSQQDISQRLPINRWMWKQLALCCDRPEEKDMKHFYEGFSTVSKKASEKKALQKRLRMMVEVYAVLGPDKAAVCQDEGLWDLLMGVFDSKKNRAFAEMLRLEPKVDLDPAMYRIFEYHTVGGFSEYLMAYYNILLQQLELSALLKQKFGSNPGQSKRSGANAIHRQIVDLRMQHHSLMMKQLGVYIEGWWRQVFADKPRWHALGLKDLAREWVLDDQQFYRRSIVLDWLELRFEDNTLNQFVELLDLIKKWFPGDQGAVEESACQFSIFLMPVLEDHFQKTLQVSQWPECMYASLAEAFLGEKGDAVEIRAQDPLHQVRHRYGLSKHPTKRMQDFIQCYDASFANPFKDKINAGDVLSVEEIAVCHAMVKEMNDETDPAIQALRRAFSPYANQWLTNDLLPRLKAFEFVGEDELAMAFPLLQLVECDAPTGLVSISHSMRGYLSIYEICQKWLGEYNRGEIIVAASYPDSWKMRANLDKTELNNGPLLQLFKSTVDRHYARLYLQKMEAGERLGAPELEACSLIFSANQGQDSMGDSMRSFLAKFDAEYGYLCDRHASQEGGAARPDASPPSP